MVLLQRKLYFSKDPEGSGSAHENQHDVIIANLRCRASRPSDERISSTCIM